MLIKTILALFLAIGVAQCQTPPGFEPSTERNLGVKFGKKVKADKGNKLEKSETQAIPHLNIKSLLDDVDPFSFPRYTLFSSSHYIVFMIDLDVPRNDTRVPFLHWYQPDLGLDTKTGKLLPSKSSKLAKAEYYPPSPPPGWEHRYVEVLFAQPSARVGFEINDFVAAANLKDPIAGNWFLVQETEDVREDL